MMLAIEKIFMSEGVLTKSKSSIHWRELDRQLNQAKALLRKMQQTVEDIEDAKTIERAKKANANKPHIPWSAVKKELGLDS